MDLFDLSWELTAGGTRGHHEKDSGLTCVGPTRLASLHQQLIQIVRHDIPGDVIEAGVWRGGCCIWMRAVLDALGDTTRTVVVADSFAGFPEPDVEKYPGDVRVHKWREKKYGFLTVGLDEVKANFARYSLTGPVEFVMGPFRETLWKLKDRVWSLIRLDGDSYEATILGLNCLYPGLSYGGYIVSDDYGDPLKGLQARQAVDDYRAIHSITVPLQWVDDRCIAWRKL